MAVVKNLMIRIGADYSAARQGMQGATRELNNFKRNTSHTVSEIRSRRGLGGIGDEFKSLGSTVTESLSQISSAKGIEGVTRSLGAMTPALGSAIAGLRGLAGAAGEAGSALGPVGVGLGALVAALALVTAGIAKASQPAVKFEADLGRLSMQLKGSTRDFMDWARAQGLAKTTSAEMGATYATLLSSFISNNRELANQTKNLVQTTRVVASATGRTIDDVTERIRSGLLGNTEAIEDLGVFVNVSMIESTKAFQKFANGKHWDQLDFRTQQQIRLQAILEQAYARYGGELQQNVMTKQTLLIEQLKDIKLNLSQAFLPIWDAILPALTKLAEGVAYVTEQIARFVYWLRGWDYDEQTKGTVKQTEAVDNQSQAYNNLASSAKKARGELAAFDQLNLLGDNNDGLGGGGGSGSGLPGPGGSPSGSGGGGGPSGIPPFPPELTKRYRIEFDPPNPPDAGIGAVATAVVSTVNNLIAQVKQKLSQMWSDLSLQTQAAAIDQQKQWNQWLNGVAGVAVPGFVVSVETDWANMWASLRAQTVTGSQAVISQIAGFLSDAKAGFIATDAAISTDWRLMLQTMLNDLSTQRIALTTQWEQWKTEIASIQNPLTSAQTAWKGALSYFQNQLNAYQPYLSWGWHLIAQDIRNLESPLADIKKSWSDTLSDMYAAASAKLGGIISAIDSVRSAWSSLQSLLSGSKASSSSSSSLVTSTSSSTSPKTSGSTVTDTGRPAWLDNMPIIGDIYKGLDKLSAETSGFANFLGQFFVPGASASGLAGLSDGVIAAASKAISGAVSSLSKAFQGIGISVPAFADGALVHGPTLAMVGDNIGASTDPEVIAPVSDLADYMSSDDDSGIIEALGRVERAVKDLRYLQAVISRSSLMDAVRDIVNDDTRRGRATFQNL